MKVILGEEGGGSGGKRCRRPGTSPRHMKASREGGAPILQRVVALPQGLPLIAEHVEVAAPSKEEGGES